VFAFGTPLSTSGLLSFYQVAVSLACNAVGRN
jgi:hypothetical protein